MAFTRSYAEQGDPFLKTTLRAGALRRPGIAGLLKPRPAAPLRARFRPTLPTARDYAQRYRMGLRLPRQLMNRRAMLAGDPFFKKLGKFIKRATKPPKAIRGVLKAVAPFASTILGFVPGVGALAQRGLAAFEKVKASPIGQAYTFGQEIAGALRQPPSPPMPEESPELYMDEPRGTVSARYYGPQPLSEPEYEPEYEDEPEYEYEDEPEYEYEDDEGDDEELIYEEAY